MLPSLPQEIIDLIVDTLALSPQRQSSLQSCALVSHSFTLRARSHLFSTLTLRWTPKSKYERPSLHRTQLLRTFLESDPIFLRSIQHLDIGIPLPLHSNMLKEITGPKSGLSEILNLLYSTPSSRLHTLSLSGFTPSVTLDSEASGPGSSDRTHFWHDIGFLPALYNLCLSGSIQTLRLGHLRQVPPEFFSKLHRNVKSIALTDVSLSEAVYLYSLPLPPTGVIERPVLEALRAPDEALFRVAHGSSSDRDVEACGADISKLTVLDCAVGFQPCWELPYWAVIQQASITLRCLRLSVDSSFHLQGPDEFALLDLATLPVLTHISFQIKDASPYYWTALNSIIRLLCSSSPASTSTSSSDPSSSFPSSSDPTSTSHTTPTQIEYIKIDLITKLDPLLVWTDTVDRTTGPSLLTQNDPAKRTSMHTLDAALTRGGRFSALKRFGMKVMCAVGDLDGVDAVGAEGNVTGGGGNVNAAAATDGVGVGDGDRGFEEADDFPMFGGTGTGMGWGIDGLSTLESAKGMVAYVSERDPGWKEVLPRAWAVGLLGSVFG